MNTILRVYNQDNVKYDLDLFQDQDFLLNISAKEAGEIPSVFGISSQNIALPATNKNNEYFGNLWNLGSTGKLYFTQTYPCQVLENGDEVFNGKIFLDSVVTDQYGDTIYNVIITDEVVDFKTQIENLTWKEVFAYFNVSGSGTNLRAGWNHPYTFTNISQSWNLDLPANPSITQPNVYLPRPGDVVYPLAEYGLKEDTAGSLLKSGGEFGTFTQIGTPMFLDQFKPAMRVNAMWKALMRYTSFEYTSSFFDSDYFDTVYYLATPSEEKGAVTTLAPSASFLADKDAEPDQIVTGLSGGTFTLVTYGNEVYDTAGFYDPGTSTYTIVTPGAYSFKTSILYSINNLNTANTSRFIVVSLNINGVTVASKAPTVGKNIGTSGFAGTILCDWKSVQLNPGDDITIKISFVTGDTNEDLKIFGTNATYFQCYNGPQSGIGQQVDFSLNFGDETVSDWLRGLIQKFNLVIEPVKDRKNVLRVEPFEEWRAAGKVVDWTDKVDRNVKFEISHPLQDQPKNIRFSDEEDKDEFNRYSIEQLDKVFGEYTYIADTTVAEGEEEVGTFFAPTPMKYIEGTNDFIVPQIYSDNNGSKRPLKFKPRLLHYLGKKSSSQLVSKIGTVVQPTGSWYVIDETPSIQTLTYYPVFHHISELPSDSSWNTNNNPSTTKDLHFGNLNHWEYHQGYVDAQTYRDAYYEYWANYLNELYDVDARLVTLNVKLNPVEINQIELNDKIFIDGAYYRINKIDGASLTNELSTPVQLIKAGSRSNPFPRRRVIKFPGIFPGGFGGGGGSTGGGGGVTTDQEYFEDIIIGEKDGNGKVIYNNYNTGEVITDYGLINQAAWKDGVLASPSGTFWETTETATPTTNINLGNNYIDDRNANSLVIGYYNDLLSEGGTNVVIGRENSVFTSDGANFLIASSASVENVVNAAITYPTRAITSSNYNDALTTGNLIVQSGFAPEYNVVDQYAGAQLQITASAEQYPFYLFDWNTVSGSSGDSYSYLPDANDLDGVEFRFQLSSSFTVGTAVTLTPSSSQKIDGSNDKTLTVTNSEYKIKSVNGGWLTTSEPVNTSFIPTQPLAYGAFYSSVSQSISGGDNTPQVVSIDQTYLNLDINLSGSGAIKFDHAGIYQLTYVVQVASLSNAQEDAIFWIKYNGANYANSTTKLSLQPRKDVITPSTQLMTLSLIGQAQNDDDYIELWWETTNAAVVYLDEDVATANYPETPSVIVNISPIR